MLDLQISYAAHRVWQRFFGGQIKAAEIKLFSFSFETILFMGCIFLGQAYFLFSLGQFKNFNWAKNFE